MDLNLSNSLIAGDPRLIDHIVGQVKSQGIFDQFRKECIADVDTKPAYQNLRSRVEGSVNSFLDKQNWKPDQNKNQLRESLRKHIHDAPYLDIGVERIVDQVVNPKTYNVFMPQIEDLVYKFLGIERPKPKEKNGPCNLKDLLPKDLDPVSPVSDKNSLKDIWMESLEDDSQSNMEITNGDDRRTPPLIDRVKIENVEVEVKKEEVEQEEQEEEREEQQQHHHQQQQQQLVEIKEEKDEVKGHVVQNDAIKTEEKAEDEEEDSPVFEPIDIMNLNESNMSNDSHLSGISELTSHRSKSPDFDFGRENFDTSNQDSQLSKVSSDSRLSIVTDFGSSNQGSNLNTEDKSKEKTVWNFDLESIKSKDSSQDSEEKVSKIVIDGNSKAEKNDKEKGSSGGSSSSKDDPSKLKPSSKNNKRSSSKDSKIHHRDKDREKDRDKKRHSSRSSDKKCRSSKEKVDESSKSRESKSDKNDKKDPPKDGKDLKDIYKEKIRELREKKEMTEKEKLNKISTESKEKRDLSKDKNKSRSCSASKSKDRSRSDKDKDKDRDRSKESKDKSRRSESDSRKSSKDEKKVRKNSDRTKSSDRSDMKVDDKNKDKSSRDKKRRDEKKRSKDDHSSLRKSSSDRRSTDRDGANGSNSKNTHKSSSSSNVSVAKMSSSNVNKSESSMNQCNSNPSDNIKNAHPGSSSKIVQKQTDGEKVTEPETCDKSHSPALPLKKRPLQKEEANTDSASVAKKQKFTHDTEMKKSEPKVDSDKMEREVEKDVRCLPDYERVQIIEVPVEYDDLDTSEEQTPWDMENTPNDILRRDATFQPNQLRSFIINDEPEPSEQWTLRLSPVQTTNMSKDSTNQDKDNETKQSSTSGDKITRELSVNIQRLPQETSTRDLKRKKGRPPKDKSEKNKVVEEEKEIDDSLDSLEFSEPSDEPPQKKRGRGRGRPKKNRDDGSSASTLANGDNLVAPLSPESDVSTADKQTSKEEKTRQRSKQHYTSDDLYKPRLSSSLSRRNRRSNPA